eukprot:1176228-Prorocentrum_minimum.AAC.4
MPSGSLLDPSELHPPDPSTRARWKLEARGGELLRREAYILRRHSSTGLDFGGSNGPAAPARRPSEASQAASDHDGAKPGSE